MLQGGASSTTTTVLTSLTYTLAIRPDVQQKLQQEQDEFVKQHGEEITLDATRKMPYALACMQEIVRTNAKTMVMREVLEDIVVDGYKFPKDYTLCMPSHQYHHMTDEEIED